MSALGDSLGRSRSISFPTFWDWALKSPFSLHSEHFRPFLSGGLFRPSTQNCTPLGLLGPVRILSFATAPDVAALPSSRRQTSLGSPVGRAALPRLQNSNSPVVLRSRRTEKRTVSEIPRASLHASAVRHLRLRSSTPRLARWRLSSPVPPSPVGAGLLRLNTHGLRDSFSHGARPAQITYTKPLIFSRGSLKTLVSSFSSKRGTLRRLR